MNKKGFTLVELLAVIIVLSLLVTIVATNGFGAFNKTKNKIDDYNLSVLKEAVKNIGVEILNCDEEISSDILDKKLYKSTGTYTCDEILSKTKSTGLNLSLKKMLEKQLVTGGELEKYGDSLNIKLKIDSNNKITVTIN